MEEEKTYKKLEKIIFHFKKYWGKYTAFFIGGSLIAMFSSSIIFNYKIEVTTMNNWVGIILGLIATMTSIISLFLSFYNLEREREESSKNIEITHKLELLLMDLQGSQGELKRILSEQKKTTEDIKDTLISSSRVSKVESAHNTKDNINNYMEILAEFVKRGKDE